MAERGRPSKYSKALAERICEELAKGKTLRAVCRADDMPTETCVRKWALEDREGFYSQYAQAREIGYLSMADELLEITDDSSRDYIERGGEEGDLSPILNHEHVTRSRLRVDTRKWLLSKALPKIYGDKIIHAGDDENPVAVKDVTDGDLARRAAFLLRSNGPKNKDRVQANGHAGNGKVPLDS